MNKTNNDNIYHMSHPWKLFCFCFLIFSIWFLRMNLTNGESITGLKCIIGLIIFILSIAGLYFFSIQYIISRDEIGYKYPFTKKTIIKTKNLIGFHINENSQHGHGTDDIVFFDDNKHKIIIQLSGKKLRNALQKYLDNIYYGLIDKTYEIIKNDGCDILGFRKKLLYRITDRGIYIKKNNLHILWNEIEDIKITAYGKFIVYEIKADKKIKFSNVSTNGYIGMTKFLLEKQNQIKR